MYEKTVDLMVGDDEIEFNVEFDASPYVPAKISGPPERCYPAEGGEVEICDVYVDGESVIATLDQEVLNRLKSKCEDCIGEIFQDEKESAEAEAADARNAAREEESWY